jgi:hypothetical protein
MNLLGVTTWLQSTLELLHAIVHLDFRHSSGLL